MKDWTPQLFDRVYRNFRSDLELLKRRLAAEDDRWQRERILGGIQAVRDSLAIMDRHRLPACRDDAFNIFGLTED